MSEVEKPTPASDDMGQLEDLLSRLEAGAFARQRLIDLVRSSEAKFRLLKTQIPAMIWTMDREMRFTAIFGTRISYSDPPPTELLGQSLFDYFQAENPVSLYATASELMNRGETAVYELKRKQRVFQVHIGPLRERGTEILGGCGCALEITDRKEAEAIVQASEQRYRELFETSEDFIYTFDLDGNFISVNNAARRVTGYDARELKQMNLAQVVAPEYRDVVRQMIESVLGGQPVRPYELEIVTKSGRRIWLEVSPRIQFVKGHPRGFHGVSHEVTERKRRELLERDRNRILELVARNETLDTILSAINGLAECQDHPAICSIWLARQGSLNHAGISKLPENFTHGFEGLRINSAGWPGARAAALGKILTADDISTDLAWEEYRESALSQHLLASCFVPILTSAGDVLGVLAVFYPDRHSPDRAEIALLEAASHLAAVAIEHQQLIDEFSENSAEPAPPATTHNNPPPGDVVDPLTVGVLVGNRLLADQVESSLRGLPVRVVLESTEIGNWSDFMERLERLRPDVLLADISLFRDAVEESVRAIRTSAGAPMVIALYPSADRDLILAAVRAGAREYLSPPIHTHLQRALQRILKDRDQKRSNRGGKVLGFVSAKGGCGATTIACHMAAELQRLTTRDVLLADFDMDAGMVRHLMKTDSPYSLLDAASNMYKLDLSFWRTLVSNQRPGLDVISGPALPPLKNLPRDVNFRNILRFVKNHYDWVVVDLGRGLNSLAMNALEEIDETFVITTPDLPALLQAKRVVQSLFDEGFGSHRIHLVLNRNSRAQAMSGTELEKLVGLPAYALIPDDRDGFDECYTRGEPVSPSTSLGRHFTQFAGKITGAQPAEKTKRRFPSFRLTLKL